MSNNILRIYDIRVEIKFNKKNQCKFLIDLEKHIQRFIISDKILCKLFLYVKDLLTKTILKPTMSVVKSKL